MFWQHTAIYCLKFLSTHSSEKCSSWFVITLISISSDTQINKIRKGLLLRDQIDSKEGLQFEVVDGTEWKSFSFFSFSSYLPSSFASLSYSSSSPAFSQGSWRGWMALGTTRVSPLNRKNQQKIPAWNGRKPWNARFSCHSYHFLIVLKT